MIVIIYFLRKNPNFTNLFGVWTMGLLYLLGLMRMLLPIEFSKLNVIIHASDVYNPVVESMFVRNVEGKILPSALCFTLLAVWLAVALALGVISYFRHRSYRKYVYAHVEAADAAERAALSRVAAEVLGSDRNVSLYLSDAVDGAMVVGLVKRTILLPQGSYSPDRLEMILRHECTHIKNRDLWVKLMIHVYCCIFWWNPFAYLLKSDLSFVLEMKCDLSVIRGMPPVQVSAYLGTLYTSVEEQAARSRRRRPYGVNAKLTNARKCKEIVRRFRTISAKPMGKVKAKLIAANVAAIVLVLTVFVTSFLFIIQPYYDEETPVEAYGMVHDDAQIVDESNAYLIRQPDGDYLFYFNDSPVLTVPREEVEQGLYEDYPIYE